MGATEVVIITGRGSGSPGGVPVVKQAIARLLGSLRRRGVVEDFSENGPGSFKIRMASVRKLLESASRSPDRRAEEEHKRIPVSREAFAGLDAEQSRELRQLAQLSLASLGVPAEGAFLQSEMERQFSILARSVPAGPDQQQRFSEALKRVLREYDDG
jgi:hypothetical protein